MGNRKKSKKIDGDFRRQICFLIFVLGNLVSVMDFLDEEIRQYKKAKGPVPEELLKDAKKIAYLYRELMAKLRPYQSYASLAARVSQKILAGLDRPRAISNLELVAFLMVVYFEEWKYKRFEFSSMFREIIYEVDNIAFDYDELSDKQTRTLISKTVDIGQKIAYRYMKGDYVEFRG